MLHKKAALTTKNNLNNMLDKKAVLTRKKLNHARQKSFPK